MTPLEQIIHRQIEKFGPMNVAEYMNLCLLHPEFGYYMTGDPLGAEGDFTTAPEISQMFGEMLGLCLLQNWHDQGCPSDIVLAELGPGRGTLMADILRVAKRDDAFMQAADVHLIEVSPTLRAIQKNLLGENVIWCVDINQLTDKPLFLVANEFFDALPVRQFVRSDKGWQEQMVGLKDGRLSFGLTAPLAVEALEDRTRATSPGDIVETCAMAQGMVRQIAGNIARNGGCAIIVDYGAWAGTGDSFQALNAHEKVDPLTSPGQADLTAHVDFAALARAADGVSVTGLTTQGILLERLGITERAKQLARNLDGATLESHIAAHRRLTHPDQMGKLFKAIALYPNGAPPPAGFEL